MSTLRILPSLLKTRLIEYLRFDSLLVKWAIVAAFRVYFRTALLRGDLTGAVKALGIVFRRSGIAGARKWATVQLRALLEVHGAATIGDAFANLTVAPAERIKSLREAVASDRYQPRARVIVLAEPKENELGVLLVKYSATFPIFRKTFDLQALGRKYVVVIEPSYSGALEPQILCLMGTGLNILVESGEPVDYKFFADVGAYQPVAVAANHWVDARVFYPEPGNKKKDYDLALVSIWSDHKRHYHLFSALAKVKSKRTFKIALIGVPIDRDQAYVKRLAEYYGVLDQLEFFEGISQQEINEILNRSKASILLSRKEGFNKACIEAMFAGVPSYLLAGHNFGHPYEHMNPETGGFVQGGALPEFLLQLDDIVADERLDPATWVIDNMSPKRSAAKLSLALEHMARREGLHINTQVVPKINAPECVYVDQEDEHRLTPHFLDLARFLRDQEQQAQ